MIESIVGVLCVALIIMIGLGMLDHITISRRLRNVANRIDTHGVAIEGIISVAMKNIASAISALVSSASWKVVACDKARVVLQLMEKQEALNALWESFEKVEAVDRWLRNYDTSSKNYILSALYLYSANHKFFNVVDSRYNSKVLTLNSKKDLCDATTYTLTIAAYYSKGSELYSAESYYGELLKAGLLKEIS